MIRASLADLPLYHFAIFATPLLFPCHNVMSFKIIKPPKSSKPPALSHLHQKLVISIR
jgi:hypothetical protein